MPLSGSSFISGGLRPSPVSGRKLSGLRTGCVGNSFVPMYRQLRRPRVERSDHEVAASLFSARTCQVEQIKQVVSSPQFFLFMD